MRKALIALFALLPALASAQVQPAPGSGAPLFGYPAPQGSSSNPFTNISFTGQALGPTGNCTTAPPYSFTGRTTTGLCSNGAGEWNLVSGGTITLRGTASAVTSSVPIVGPAGSTSAPTFAFTGETNSGWYYRGGGLISLSLLGSEVHRFGASTYGFLSDTASIQFGSGSDVAISRGAANRLDLASGDSFRVVNGNVNIASGEFQSAGDRINYNLSAYGAGTAYSLTNSAAAIDFGTTDPAIVLDKAGTYQLCGQVNLAYNGATVVAETATIKVRRTNNTAADLSPVVVLDLPVTTTLTHTYGIFPIPCVFYTTAATDDAITLFANVSAALGAGSIDATAVGTVITAVRLY